MRYEFVPKLNDFAILQIYHLHNDIKSYREVLKRRAITGFNMGPVENSE